MAFVLSFLFALVVSWYLEVRNSRLTTLPLDWARIIVAAIISVAIVSFLLQLVRALG
ncbi:MAG TPA: hypothetical protein VK694_08225 [Verrucomicrobiae bacterium]|nr:hypothetical protein [Verrucomicrobiae bacterium]